MVENETGSQPMVSKEENSSNDHKGEFGRESFPSHAFGCPPTLPRLTPALWSLGDALSTRPREAAPASLMYRHRGQRSGMRAAFDLEVWRWPARSSIRLTSWKPHDLGQTYFSEPQCFVCNTGVTGNQRIPTIFVFTPVLVAKTPHSTARILVPETSSLKRFPCQQPWRFHTSLYVRGGAHSPVGQPPPPLPHGTPQCDANHLQSRRAELTVDSGFHEAEGYEDGGLLSAQENH